MRLFKTITICLIAAVAMTACHFNDNNSGKGNANSDSLLNEENTLLRDSLNMAKDYMNSLSSLVNEVSDGLSEIKQLEQIISTTNFGEEAPNRREQLRNDILLIKNSIQNRMNRLKDLEE